MLKHVYQSLKNNKYKIVFWTILLVVAYSTKIWKSLSIKECTKYSIIKPLNISGGFSSGISMHYKLSYKNCLFEGVDGNGIKETEAIGNPTYYLGKRYFVRFNCEYPESSEIVWDISIPDTLTFIPPNGWDKIPYKLDKLAEE